ncbi:MAG: PEP-CTERM sorting domain-containing protein [Azoarcus sp.]|jgi:hypothetical protein|nr:PEP-CTERM sorting domain-containing protein [Azoarcus sp.]
MMSKLFAASLLALSIAAVAAPSAYAENIIAPPPLPSTNVGNTGNVGNAGNTGNVGSVIQGQLRDTSNASASQWQVKYLGGQNTCSGIFCSSNETFNWAAQRTYANGILNTAGYKNAMGIGSDRAASLHWNTDYSWISTPDYYTIGGLQYTGVADNGYYSFVTMIDDSQSTGNGVNQTVTLDTLRIGFTSDDHVHAIIINGTVYSAFAAQDANRFSWEMDYVEIIANDIAWNVYGNNTIEFIVHNNNSNNLGNGSSTWLNTPNGMGFSATIQATYLAQVVPEPEAYAMMLAGLAMIGTVARRRRSKSL